MKRVNVFVFPLIAVLGCAEVAPTIVSDQQARAFQTVVEQAKEAGAEDTYSPAGAKLRSAQSDFYYAQHLPSDPARARRIAAEANEEAEEALALARGSVATHLTSSGSSDVP